MNRSVTRLLAAALLVSTAAFAASKSETNRTFINTRDFRNRVENLTIFHKAISHESDDLIGGNMQLVPFYLQTKNDSRDELAKGFGVDHLGSFKFDDSTAIGTSLGYVDSAKLIHDRDAYASTPTYSEITLKPEHKAYGINFNYVHKLDELADGLWFAVTTGLVKVEHKIGVEFAAEVAPTSGENTVTKISKYLDGTEENVSTSANYQENRQKKLTHAKIDAEMRDDSGFNDVETILGWNFVEKDNARLGFSVACVIPTGNEPTAEFMFEPLYGGRHWQFGAGLHGCGKLWEEDDKALKIIFDANYRYGFEREVKRMVGIKDNNWGNYYLVQKNDAAIDAQLIPAANLLAMDWNVTPGSMLDATAMISGCFKAFVMDVGYNVYACQAQKPTLKDSWTDDSYYIVDRRFNTHLAYTNATNTAYTHVALNKDTFDKDIDSQIIHKIFAAAGAVTTEWDYPMTIGIGGSVEFVQGSKKQITPANYEVFGKVGVTF